VERRGAGGGGIGGRNGPDDEVEGAMNRLTRAKLDQMTYRGMRRHLCQDCGEVFECDECTEAMHAAQVRMSVEHVGTVLYASRHFVARGEARILWLCDSCATQKVKCG